MYSRSRFTGGFGIGGPTPITIGVIAAVVALYVLSLTGLGSHFIPWLQFSAETFPMNFWTVLTWPLVTFADPIGFLFILGWFYFMASSLERSWGTRDFGVVLGMLAVIMALLSWSSYLLFHVGGGIAGIPLFTGPLMVAWAIINRRETINIWFLPVPAPVIGWLGVAETWFFGGIGLPGLFLLPACGLMYWYVTQGRYGGSSSGASAGTFVRTFQDRHRSGLRLDDFDRSPSSARRPGPLDESDKPGGFSLVRWWRDRKEKKRLEEIFRRSGFTDDDERR